MSTNSEVCTIVPLTQVGFRPLVFGMGFLVSDREILTCAHVIEAVLGRDWFPGPGEVRVCFPFSQDLVCLNGNVDRKRWFPPGPPLPGAPTDIAIIHLQRDAPSSINRAVVRRHETGLLAKIYGFRGKDLPDGAVRSHEEGEWIEGKVVDELPAGRGQFVGMHGSGATIEKGFSGSGVRDLENGVIVGMIVEAELDKPKKIAQFIDVPSLENALGRRLAVDLPPDPLAEHSPQTIAIRSATAYDCYKIKFLGGEKGMDEDDGYYRILTVRGRRPADQAEIAQAVEYLINDTPREDPAVAASGKLSFGRLPAGSSLKQGVEETDPQSWPDVSLDERIREKCADEGRTQLRALLLTDDPGGGKSTTARNVAWRVAERKKPFENERRQPVYIRLRDWENFGQSPASLASYLASWHSTDSRRSTWPQIDFWEKALGDVDSYAGSLFLVLDGLDEVSSSSFALDLLDEVRRWALQGNVVLVTCRTRSVAAYKNKLTGFDILRITGLDPNERRLFIRKYPGLTNPDKLAEDLKHHPTIRQLVTYPFLLDVVCYLAANDHGELPECRNELIERAIDQLLREASTQFEWPSNERLSNQILRRILARASLMLRLREQQGRVHNLFSFETLETYVDQALGHETSVRVTATSLTTFYSRVRFLQFPPEHELSGRSIGCFSHGLFLDFLAAEGFKLAIDSTDDGWNAQVPHFPVNTRLRELLLAKALDPAWFELLSFLPSRLSKPVAFFEILCEFPDDLSRRKATLAIRSLAELSSRALADPEVRRWSEPVAQSCWDIAEHHWQSGIEKLAETLVTEISSITRVHPGLVERLAYDLESPRLQSRREALVGLDQIGAAAVQFRSVIDGLLFNLRDRNWSIRKLAAKALAKMGPLATRAVIDGPMQSEKWYEQASGCETIGLMGTAALALKTIPVIPTLLKLIVHPQPLVRASACEALGNLGPDIPDVEAALCKLTTCASPSEEDATARAQACAALGKYGSEGAASVPAIEALISSLAHTEWVVRSSASIALSELSGETALDRSHLVRELIGHSQPGSRPEVRAIVCMTLGKLRSVFSSHAESMTEVLKTNLSGDDLDACKCASEAICSLGIKIGDHRLFERFLTTLGNSDWQARASAVEALGYLKASIADEPEQVLDELFQNLRQDSRWYVRAGSCDVLAQLAPNLPSVHRGIVEALTELLTPSEADAEGYVTVKAIKALGKVGLTKIGSTSVLQRIGTFLTSPNWREQISACQALADVGPECASIAGVLDGLTKCLTSDVWFVRANACKTLNKLEDPFDREEMLAALIACVCDEQQPVRSEAAELTSKLASADKFNLIIVDSQHKKLVARRADSHPITIPFPKPSPPLFMLSLPSADSFRRDEIANRV